MQSNLKVTPVKKDVWFLIKLKSDITYLEEGLKSFTERISLVEFDSIKEADDYFQLIEQNNKQFTIIADYMKNG